MTVDANDYIDDFNVANTTTNSFSLKANITAPTSNNRTKNVK